LVVEDWLLKIKDWLSFRYAKESSLSHNTKKPGNKSQALSFDV